MRFDAGNAKLLPLQMRAADIERWLLEREPRSIGRFDEIGQEEYSRAFTAARTAGADVVDDLYYAFIDTVSRSGSEQDFGKLVIPTLRAKGWLDGDERQIARRVELIYDTNLRLARASGRWDRYWSTRETFPYLLGFTAGDERVRHPPKSPHADHTAWDGICLPIDHPFWREYWTPLGFRCRCGIRQLTRSQFARRKGGVTSEDDLAQRKARLGPPAFLAPGRPMVDKLAAMVAPTNAERMPGLRPINPAATAGAGVELFESDRRADIAAAIGAELDRIGFGRIAEAVVSTIDTILASFDAPDRAARLYAWARFRRKMEEVVQRDPGNVNARLALEEAKRVEEAKR